MASVIGRGPIRPGPPTLREPFPFEERWPSGGVRGIARLCFARIAGLLHHAKGPALRALSYDRLDARELDVPHEFLGAPA